MKRAALILAGLLAFGALAFEAEVGGGRDVVMSAPLTTSGHLPQCLPADCKYQCAAGASGTWNCRTGAGVALPVDGGASAASVATPFVSSPGGTATWAQEDVTDTSAWMIPNYATVDAGIRYDSDHTVLCASAPSTTGGVSPVVVAHGNGGSQTQAFYMQALNNRAYCTWGSDPVLQSVASNGGGTSVDCTAKRWLVQSCRLSGTSATARVNGVQASATIDPPNAEPIAAHRYVAFGRYRDTGNAIRGPLAFCQMWNRALSDAEVTRIEASWMGAIGGTRNVTTDRNSTQFLEHSDGYVYAFADDAAAVDSTKGLFSHAARTNYWTNSLDLSAQTDVGTPTECPAGTPANCNALSGPLSRYNNGAEADYLGDDDGAASEGVMSATAGTTKAWYTASCYLRSVDAGHYSLGITTDGTGSGACTGTDLTTSWARKTCTIHVDGGSPSYIKAQLLVGDGVDDIGTIAASQCQLEVATSAGPPIVCGASACATIADTHTMSTAGFPLGSGEVELSYTPWAAISEARTLFDTIASNNGVRIGITSDDKLQLTLGDGTGTTTTTSGALTWTGGTTYRIRVRWGGGTAHAFRDSVSVASTSGTAKIPTAHATSAAIGALVAGTTQANGHMKVLR